MSSWKWPWTTHLTNSPEGVFWSRKQAAGWKSALSAQSGMSCLVSWMYMLYPQPGEGTIHRLLPGSFLWPWGCRRATDSKASHSSCWLLPPLHPAALPSNDDREQLLRWRFEFLFSLAEKQRARERVVWLRRFSLLCDSWRDVWNECQSILIWVMLIWLCIFGAYCRWPVMSVQMKTDSNMLHDSQPLHKLLVLYLRWLCPHILYLSCLA